MEWIELALPAGYLGGCLKLIEPACSNPWESQLKFRSKERLLEARWELQMILAVLVGKVLWAHHRTSASDLQSRQDRSTIVTRQLGHVCPLRLLFE